MRIVGRIVAARQMRSTGKHMLNLLFVPSRFDSPGQSPANVPRLASNGPGTGLAMLDSTSTATAEPAIAPAASAISHGWAVAGAVTTLLVGGLAALEVRPPAQKLFRLPHLHPVYGTAEICVLG